MDQARPDDVIDLVVAWHNRHPLARRIAASQVHSLGEVVLPFTARPATGAPGDEWTDTAAPGNGDAASRMGLRALFARLGAWTKSAALHAAFSGDFAWPTTSKRLARWARRHGRSDSFVPEDWPQRDVDIDPFVQQRLHQRGLTQPLSLHVMTAAVGVGDRRMRLLIGADGAVIGPRAFSRRRQAAGAALAMALLVAAGYTARADIETAAPTQLAANTSAASSPARAASATGAAAMPATLSDSVATAPPLITPHLAVAASSPPQVAQTAPPAHAASSLHAHERPATPTATTTATPTATQTPAATTTPPPTPPATLLASPPTNLAQTPATPLGRIKPVIDDATRRAALAQSIALRRSAAQPGVAIALAGPVYALVTAPTRQREQSEARLARLQAARANAQTPVPTRSELIEARGNWRAAWWPFASRGDAERARVMLAARGLKAEVVEF